MAIWNLDDPRRRDWGTQHGRLLATDCEIREAVLAGREVDWFEYPPMMWDSIGFSEEVRIQAEDAAWCAAQAEALGHRVCIAGHQVLYLASKDA